MDLLIISSFAFLWDFYVSHGLYIVFPLGYFCLYTTILVCILIFNIYPYYYYACVVSNERIKERGWWNDRKNMGCVLGVI